MTEAILPLLCCRSVWSRTSKKVGGHYPDVLLLLNALPCACTMNLASLCNWRGARLLLLFLPATLALAYYVHLQTVDLHWLYETNLTQVVGRDKANELASVLVAHGTMWNFGKVAFWPILLFVLELFVLMACASSIALLLGITRQGRNLAMAALWSKSTVFVTAIVALVARGLVEKPARVLTKDLDPLSWNSVLHIPGDGALQYYTSFHGPLSLVGVGILALAFRQLTHRGWPQSILFGLIPYALVEASQFYLFRFVFG